jgi:putative oxidoreductase
MERFNMFGQLITRWLPVVLRAAAVYVLFEPALNKFRSTEAMVGFFGSLGIPSPEIMVLLVGVVEVSAVILFATGILGRVIAVPLSVVMIVAMATAGVNQNNIIVLVSSLGILALGTGALSLWQPEGDLLGRFRFRVRQQRSAQAGA